MDGGRHGVKGDLVRWTRVVGNGTEEEGRRRSCTEGSNFGGGERFPLGEMKMENEAESFDRNERFYEGRDIIRFKIGINGKE